MIRNQSTIEFSFWNIFSNHYSSSSNSVSGNSRPRLELVLIMCLGTTIFTLWLWQIYLSKSYFSCVIFLLDPDSDWDQCPPQVHMLKTWSSTCRAIGRWWCRKEAELTGKQLGHGTCPGRGFWDTSPSSFSVFPSQSASGRLTPSFTCSHLYVPLCCIM